MGLGSALGSIGGSAFGGPLGGGIGGAIGGIFDGGLGDAVGGLVDWTAMEHRDRVAFAKAYKALVQGGPNGTGTDVNARQVARIAIPPGHYRNGPQPPTMTPQAAAAKYPRGVNRDGSSRGDGWGDAGTGGGGDTGGGGSATKIPGWVWVAGAAALLLGGKRG